MGRRSMGRGIDVRGCGHYFVHVRSLHWFDLSLFAITSLASHTHVTPACPSSCLGTSPKTSLLPLPSSTSSFPPTRCRTDYTPAALPSQDVYCSEVTSRSLAAFQAQDRLLHRCEPLRMERAMGCFRLFQTCLSVRCKGGGLKS